MTKTITVLCACLLSLGVAITIGAVHQRAAAGQVALAPATTHAQPADQAALESAARSASHGVFAPIKASSTAQDSVLESQDAASCSAGGWQMVVRGWGDNCCGSTQKWLRFSGATPVFKCCGVCATGA